MGEGHATLLYRSSQRTRGPRCWIPACAGMIEVYRSFTYLNGPAILAHRRRACRANWCDAESPRRAHRRGFRRALRSVLVSDDLSQQHPEKMFAVLKLTFDRPASRSPHG